MNQIERLLNYTYKQSTGCLKEKCFFNCLLKNSADKKFKKYTEKDIPGPYPYDYPCLKNTKNICHSKTIIFISVITSCSQLEERVAVRKIYKKINSEIQFHFFVGYTTKQCQDLLYYENKIYSDISQMPIKESFANETIFTLYLHKILPNICPNAIYYGKMDADQYIDFKKLEIILEERKNKKNIFYVCKLWRLVRINVDQEWKYSSPKFIFKYYNSSFPNYGIPCFTGSFALWPSYLSKEIYRESLNEKHIIRMDDQHISWLIYKLNQRNKNITYYNLRCHNIKKLIDMNMSCGIKYKTSIGIHQLKGRTLFSFFMLLNR